MRLRWVYLMQSTKKKTPEIMGFDVINVMNRNVDELNQC